MEGKKTYPPLSKRKALFSLLLACIYITVFLSHDLVFIESDFSRSANPFGSTKLSQQTHRSKSILTSQEHNCPFCFGFVDSHARLEIIFACSSSTPTAVAISSLHDLACIDLRRSRGPPPILS